MHTLGPKGKGSEVSQLYACIHLPGSQCHSQGRHGCCMYSSGVPRCGWCCSLNLETQYALHLRRCCYYIKLKRYKWLELNKSLCFCPPSHATLGAPISLLPRTPRHLYSKILSPCAQNSLPPTVTWIKHRKVHGMGIYY